MRFSWPRATVGGVAKAAGAGGCLHRQREAWVVVQLRVVEPRSASWQWRCLARDPAGREGTRARQSSSRGDVRAGHASLLVATTPSQ